MKRTFLLISLLLLVAMLPAIQCLMADGSRIPADSRDYHFRYHNSTNDYYFFGANKWAVSFDFSTAYPGLSALEFEISAARLWFPNPGDEVQIELCTDVDGQPGEVVRSASAFINQSLMDISFGESYSASKIWLMVSYTTDIGHRWVSASQSGGSNSYFMNEVGDIQMLSSFATAGFGCELLFGLLGDFQLAEPDLQLCSFDLSGELLPGNRVKPAFSIYNHGTESVTSANLELVFSRPGETAYQTLDIPLEEAIPAYSLVEYGVETSWLPEIELPDTPTQISLIASLSSEYTENDTLQINNLITRSYGVFADEMPVVLIENFLRQDETGVICTLQDAVINEHHQRINYYPILSDSLSNLQAQRRFNWYQFNSVPRTVALGDKRITGFREDYSELFSTLISDVQSRRTFVSSSSCSTVPVEGSESIQVEIQLSNAQTDLYSGSGQGIMSGSRFFVALVKKFLGDGYESYVLDRFISFADTIGIAMSAGSSFSKMYSFSSSGITNGELVDNYRLIYWLQGVGGGRIHYANFCDFRPETYVSNSDPLPPVPSIRIWPNPASPSFGINIEAKDLVNGSISVFNIRGQKLCQLDDFKGQHTLPETTFPASGIYIIRFSDTMGRSISKRISIIK
ncbi:MAG: T9SS type A sorting domain-containing protein [Candidatus Cloacimonetes bacterium]|nr:T9SS type A sorting domain-containing protein [Candidatus Cloacimonadota bacterium]